MDDSFTVKLKPASDKYPDKKWQVTIPKYGQIPKRTLAFGAKGYTDFLVSKDPEKKK